MATSDEVEVIQIRDEYYRSPTRKNQFPSAKVPLWLIEAYAEARGPYVDLKRELRKYFKRAKKYKHEQ